MILFVFFIAVLNLAVGYAFGAGLVSTSGMPSVSLGDLLSNFKRSGPEEIDEEDQLTITVAPLEDFEDYDEADEEAEVEFAEEPVEKEKSQEEMIAGLSGFREKLTNVSLELKLSKEDPTAFKDCAVKLQVIDHEYVELASDVVESLDKSVPTASESREALSKDAQEARRLCGKLDELLEKQSVKSGENILLTAFGAGLTWGSTVLTHE